MSDLIDDPSLGENAPEFSVSDLSGAIKRMIEGEFSHVRVRGELGRISRPRSGHVYLDLKDDRSVLAGIIWKGVASRLAVQPEEGMEVIATGRLTTFPGQSRYQIIIEDLKPAGMGALMAMLERRKQALAAEGLFSPERKRPLPYLPDIIGVVTSPSGAVIRDILHRLRERFPRKVLLWPVAVQGEACAAEVARAIRGFNALSPGGPLPRPDLIIVARGGGSVEDLWGFNEEIVVRAAAESAIPLISAVGHETDTTLIDLAADKRAPTPTAAAELAVPVRLDLLVWLDGQAMRLSQALSTGVAMRAQRLRDLSRALPRPETLLDSARQRLDTWSDRLPSALIRVVQTRRIHLAEISGALRPGLLRRAFEADRRRLDHTAARLNIKALHRDMDVKRRELDRLADQFAEVATRQTRALRERIEGLDRLRETLGYTATLKRGYAVVWGDGSVATTQSAALSSNKLEIEFMDGRLGVGRATALAKPERKTQKPIAEDGATKGQGSLF